MEGFFATAKIDQRKHDTGEQLVNQALTRQTTPTPCNYNNNATIPARATPITSAPNVGTAAAPEATDTDPEAAAELHCATAPPAKVGNLDGTTLTLRLTKY